MVVASSTDQCHAYIAPEAFRTPYGGMASLMPVAQKAVVGKEAALPTVAQPHCMQSYVEQPYFVVFAVPVAATGYGTAEPMLQPYYQPQMAAPVWGTQDVCPGWTERASCATDSVAADSICGDPAQPMMEELEADPPVAGDSHGRPHWASDEDDDDTGAAADDEAGRDGDAEPREGEGGGRREGVAAGLAEDAEAAHTRRGSGTALQRRRRRQRAASQGGLPTGYFERSPGDVRRAPPATRASMANQIMAQLKEGGEALNAAIGILREPGVVRCLAFDPSGCRAIQLALDVVDRRAAAEIASRLQGSVAEALRSPHANYVLQKIIKVLTHHEAPFVVAELSAASRDLAHHEYGCRIFCRLLEHSATEDKVVQLMDEVLLNTDELVRHTFGHHVVECALEHGLPHQREHIIDTLRRNLLRNARHRNAAYVVEKALMYGSPEDRKTLANDILAHSPSDVAALARSHFGSMIIRALVRMPGSIGQQVQEHIRGCGAQAQFKATRHGRRPFEEHSSR